ncbi:MAG: glycosyltransferase family 2 protein [Bacteroidetes bacterium]|nr:glycosyltransferase family 2 protein [Bacteroidota bacterium]MCL2301994.1 glycosyltransferase family 2 protein [Lentimicrobiaceae bacterium]
MQLSIVIVNYNVKHFLMQCLQSVQKAIAGMEAEVFVVDNASSDDSVEMLQEKFPWVNLIANTENVGFSCANNQAIKLAKGEFILLLNPDTLVEEDTFVKCIDFMKQTPDAGALGVKMINGNGEFLPESKRALPIPSVAFYKIFGLSKLFPRSKKFGSYHLTYLDNDKTQSVEVLSGAFMFIRKKVLDEIGLLDETFFMYGEDIDLSYRIIKAGYKNYYLPDPRIIHYKGESTKKGSINYVVVFYKAMQIFAKKHFTNKKSFLLTWILNLAIWFRASLAIGKRVAASLLLPLLDISFIYGGMLLLAFYWQTQVLEYRDSHFPDYYFFLVIPCYIAVWIVSVAINKGYKKPYSTFKTNRGIIFGTIVILLIYALLPETIRFSRAVTIFGAAWTAIAMNGIRYLLHKFKLKGYRYADSTKRRVLIIGDLPETERVAIIAQIGNQKPEAIYTTADAGSSAIKNLVKENRVNELILCSKDISIKNIISHFIELKTCSVSYKIAPEGEQAVIGSRNIQYPVVGTVLKEHR